MADSTALRALKRNGRVLEPDYTRQRRDLAAARRAAFLVPPSGPNQVWQLDFTEYETTTGGTWRISGCADYWAKAAFGSLKYEHLYRLEIPDGPTLAAEVEAYRETFNWIRPHEAIGMMRPMDRYLDALTRAPTLTLNEPETRLFGGSRGSVGAVR